MEYKYCPNCKNELENSKDLFECKNCGMKIFKNSVPTSSIIPVKDGKILITVRGIEPKKGQYDFIGGFLRNGEDPLKGAIREAKEETGTDVKIIDLLGIYIDEYEYQNRVVKTFNLIYIAKINSGNPRASDDASELVWFDVDKVPKLAFRAEEKAIEDLKEYLKTHEI